MPNFKARDGFHDLRGGIHDDEPNSDDLGAVQDLIRRQSHGTTLLSINMTRQSNRVVAGLFVTGMPHPAIGSAMEVQVRHSGTEGRGE